MKIRNRLQWRQVRDVLFLLLFFSVGPTFWLLLILWLVK